MPTDDDIDQLLREDSADWRAATDTDTRVDLARIAAHDTPGLSKRATAGLVVGGAMLAIAAVAVVVGTGRLAFFAVPAATQTAPAIADVSPSPSPTFASLPVTSAESPGQPPASTVTPSPTPSASPQRLEPEEIHFGDRVVGRGQVISVPGSPPYLCADVLATGFDLPACGMSLLVDVFDFEPRTVAGTDHSGIWLTNKVELHGTWQRDGLHVTAAKVVDQTDFPVVPCSPPMGGWPGLVGDVAAERDDLNHYFDEHLDRLMGPWLASVDGREPTPDGTILVVGTVDDPAVVSGELAALYRSSLCVTHVDYSFTTLMDIKRSIGPAHGRFVADFDDSRDRLLIKPYMLTSAVTDQLADYAAYLIVEPLLRLDD